MPSSSSATDRPVRRSVPPDDLRIGRVLNDRYRIEARLGAGGVGAVYRAVHIILQSPVAIKVLQEELGMVEELRKRFLREAKVVMPLSHPNIVSVNDYGITDDHMPYLVMELLEGQTLEQLLKRPKPLEISKVFDIWRAILRGLAFAHASGVLHRDLKPANVFLIALPDDPYHVKLLDFGLAKIASAEGEETSEPTLTKLGTILGTPAYMSPEQASGGSADARTDVYSAGVLLFEMLTGRQPFVASSRPELLRAHLIEPMPRLEEVRPGLRVTPELHALLEKALAKERVDRFADAQEMLAAVNQLPTPAATYVEPSTSVSVEDPTVPVSDSLIAQGAEKRKRDGSFSVRRRLAPVALALLVALIWVFWPEDQQTADVATTDEAGVQQGSASAAEKGEGSTAVATAGARQDVGEESTGGPTATEETPGSPSTPKVRRAPARDPFRRGTPRALRRYRRKVQAGRELSRRDQNVFYAYQKAHPDDPRPSLIMAHDFRQRGWYTDALKRYELAFQKHSSARGAPRMLPDMIHMLGVASVRNKAASAIEEIYGAEAIGALERAKKRTADDQTRAAIERLLHRLRAARR